MHDVTDLTRISPVLDSRACTFENPTGARGAGGAEANGRKGRPFKELEPGEVVTLADVDGPGVVRHIWMTFPPAPPEVMRAMVVEAFYDGADEPSVSVPAVDFFGVAMGRPQPMSSALTAIQEGRGFNSSRLERYVAEGLVAGTGLNEPREGGPPFLGHGIVERVDDYSAVAFTMCRDVQPVPRVDIAAATADLERRDYESAGPFELMLTASGVV